MSAHGPKAGGARDHRKRDTRDANLATGISQDHAITPGQVNPFANIICSRPRLGTDPDLISRERTWPAFKQDWVPSGKDCREPPLKRGISIQNCGARSVCPENGAPRLDRARDDMLFERYQEIQRSAFDLRHQRFATSPAFGFGP